MFGIFKDKKWFQDEIECYKQLIAVKDARIEELYRENHKQLYEIIAYTRKNGELKDQLATSEQFSAQYLKMAKDYAEKIQELEKEVQYQKRENQLLVLFAENLKKENDILRMCSRSF